MLEDVRAEEHVAADDDDESDPVFGAHVVEGVSQVVGGVGAILKELSRDLSSGVELGTLSLGGVCLVLHFCICKTGEEEEKLGKVSNLSEIEGLSCVMYKDVESKVVSKASNPTRWLQTFHTRVSVEEGE